MNNMKILKPILILVSTVLFNSCTEPDFYTIKLSEQSKVLITRSDNDQKIGPIKINEKFENGTYNLGTEDDNKGIYKLEFIDTTLTPGRVTIFIGNTKLDIMESIVIINNQEHEWKK
ncbi:MAG: hypothetical protein MK041_13845 [Aquabacterium sp.]|nr:hypothetical protein [Aquabacterium sp.]